MQDSTIKEYNFDLTIFFRFLKFYYRLEDVSKVANFESVKIDDISFDVLLKIKKEDILAYLYFLSENNYNLSTRNRKFYCLKNFFNYLFLYKKVIFASPTENISVSKAQETLPMYLSVKEIKRFFAPYKKYNNTPVVIRNYTICVLLLCLGLRVSEISNLNIDSFNLQEETVKVLGKGNKERVLYLSKSCILAINKYLEVRNYIFPKNSCCSNEVSFFVSHLGKRISTRTIQEIVKEELKTAGLDTTKYSAHKLRHTTATLMIQNGIDIRVIQEILGHTCINSTEIYTHLDNSKIRKGIKQNPLANFHKEVKDCYEKANK